MNTARPTTPPPRRRLAAACAAAVWLGLSLAWTGAAGAQTATPIIATPTSWGQFQGSALHTGVAGDGGEGAAPAPPYTEAWHTAVPLGGPNGQWGLSSPVIAGDIAVAVGPTQVMGFKVADGSQAFAPVDRTLGPSVPPAVAEVGRTTAIVYTQGFGTEPASALPTSPSASVSAAPSTVAPPTATPTGTPSASGSPTEGVAAATSQLAAFDLATQKPLWPPVALDQVSRTGVTVEGTTAYVGDDLGTIYAVDLTEGKILWHQAVGGSPLAPVAVVGDLVVATVPGSSQERPAVAALKTTDGSLAWRYQGAGFGTALSAAAAPGTGDAVYVAFPDQVVRALGTDGVVRWSRRLNASVTPTGSAVVTGNAVYTLDLFGQVTRLDPSTGDVVWDFAINEPVTRGAPIFAGGRVLAATGKGRLVAIDPQSGRLVWQSDEGDGLLRGLTPTGDLILAVRGGTDAGLVAFRNDPNGTLVDVVSPTVFDATTFTGNFALAALGFVVVLVLLGRVLASRLGPAFITDGEEEEDGPQDPWGDDEG